MVAKHEDLDISIIEESEETPLSSSEDASSEATSQPTSQKKDAPKEAVFHRVITGAWDKEEGEPTPYITDTLSDQITFAPPGQSAGEVDKLLERHKTEKSTQSF